MSVGRRWASSARASSGRRATIEPDPDEGRAGEQREGGGAVGARRGIVGRLARSRLNRAPVIVLFAQVTHVVGDTAIGAALATTLFFDVPVGEARTQVALYLGLAFAPYALLSPIVSRAMRRRDRAHGTAIVASDIGRALLAALLIPEVDSLLLYPLGFGLLVLSRIHSVSRNALLPELLERDGDLLEANAAVSVTSGAAGLIGGGTAVALAAVFGSTAPLLLAALAFAAGSMAGLWLAPPLLRRVAEPAPAWRPDAATRRMAAALVASRAALGFVGLLLAFAFHDPESNLELTASLGALALGIGVAPFTIGLARRLVREHLAGASLGVLAVTASAVSLLDGFAAAAALSGLVGFSAASARLAFDAHVQERVPVAARAGAYARYETFLQLGWIGGAAAGSLLELSVRSGGYVVAAIAVAGLAAGHVVGRSHRP